MPITELCGLRICLNNFDIVVDAARAGDCQFVYLVIDLGNPVTRESCEATKCLYKLITFKVDYGNHCQQIDCVSS